MALDDGKVRPLVFDAASAFPFRVNPVPFINLLSYDNKRDLLLNVVGNAVMFIPVGIILPVAFKRLDSFWKVLAVGAVISLCIEIIQLPFSVRASDIDDLIMNTVGVAIGYAVYELIRKLKILDILKVKDTAGEFHGSDDVYDRQVISGGSVVVAVVVNHAAAADVPWYAYIDRIEGVTIVDGITRVGDNAFAALTDNGELQAVLMAAGIKISLPKTIQSLGAGSIPAGSSIDFVGSKEEWKAIEIPQEVADAIPEPQYDAAQAVPVSGTDVGMKETENEIILDIRLDGVFTSADTEAFVYAATYDEDGNFAAIKKVPLSKDGSATVSIDKDGAFGIRALAWTDGMQPLTNGYSSGV